MMLTRHEYKLNATLILVIMEVLELKSNVYTTFRSKLIWLSKTGDFNPAVFKILYLF